MLITRRRLIATSATGVAAGGAATVLAACGADAREERTPERDAELLQRALTAQATVGDLYDLAAGHALDPPVASAIEAFAEQSRELIGMLSDAIEGAGGNPEEAPGGTPPGESVVEAIRLGLDDAVAACHGIVGDLSAVEARRAIYRTMVADSSQLSVFRGVLGEPQVPAAFVTGGAEPPLAVDPEAGRDPEDGS